MKTFLNVGCGAAIGPHWHNLDSSRLVFLDRHRILKSLLKPILPASAATEKFKGAMYMDARKKWSYADASVDGIYTSHFLEHLTFRDAQHVIREAYRVLKPGGVVRFVLPNVEFMIQEYLEGKKKGDKLAATKLSWEIDVFQHFAPKKNFLARIEAKIYDKNSHKFLYDNESLTFYLEEVGFKNITKMAPHTSALPNINEVEKVHLVGAGSICLEGIKPKQAEQEKQAA